jgi:hypothetical protein
MGDRFLMARYRPSEALLDQIFMQRWGKVNLTANSAAVFKRSATLNVWQWYKGGAP